MDDTVGDAGLFQRDLLHSKYFQMDCTHQMGSLVVSGSAQLFILDTFWFPYTFISEINESLDMFKNSQESYGTFKINR